MSLVEGEILWLTSLKVVFPINCHTADLEDVKQGKEHWHWNPDIPLYIGVLPRRGAKSEDVNVYNPDMWQPQYKVHPSSS